MSMTFGKACGLAGALALSFLAAGAHAQDSRAVPSGVRIEATDEIGQVLADAQGHTLYTWDGDRKADESLCDDTHVTRANGGGSKHYFVPDPDTRPTCQQVWPPFLASADARPVGAWTLVKRADGTTQWARGGKPLYTFAFDAHPGEINGAGRQGGRRPARLDPPAPAGIVAGDTASGLMLMTDRGKPLYVGAGARDPQGWLPLLAPAVAANPPRGWAIADLPGGVRQWRFDGQGVYIYAEDVPFGEPQGAGEPGWRPLVIQPPMAHPAELTVHMTGEGPAFADKAGMTAYLFACAEETADREICDMPGASPSYWRAMCGPPDACRKLWRPIEAPADAKPIGRTWSIVTIDPTGASQFPAPGQPALRVWAYRGRPLYTYLRDHAPGDQNGQMIAAGLQWGFAVLRPEGGLY
jgi:predicted lipoprotein with Yx(FWY)xxD motif